MQLRQHGRVCTNTSATPAAFLLSATPGFSPPCVLVTLSCYHTPADFSDVSCSKTSLTVYCFRLRDLVKAIKWLGWAQDAARFPVTCTRLRLLGGAGPGRLQRSFVVVAVHTGEQPRPAGRWVKNAADVPGHLFHGQVDCAPSPWNLGGLTTALPSHAERKWCHVTSEVRSVKVIRPLPCLPEPSLEPRAAVQEPSSSEAATWESHVYWSQLAPTAKPLPPRHQIKERRSLQMTPSPRWPSHPLVIWVLPIGSFDTEWRQIIAITGSPDF